MKFKEKTYSSYIKDYTLGGLGIGASVGTIVASGAPGKIGNVFPKFKLPKVGKYGGKTVDINKNYNNLNPDNLITKKSNVGFLKVSTPAPSPQKPTQNTNKGSINNTKNGIKPTGNNNKPTKFNKNNKPVVSENNKIPKKQQTNNGGGNKTEIIINNYDKEKDEISKSSKATLQQKLAIVGSCAIIGGLLGFIIGSVKKANESGSRSFAGSDRFYKNLIGRLRSNSLVEGLDFTLDPKTADRLKSKVCMVISGDSSEFKLGISCKNDPKLENASKRVLSNYSVRKDTVNKDRSQNRFNDVSISTLVNRDDNLKTVVDIVKGFVKEGYPVYIVDVSN